MACPRCHHSIAYVRIDEGPRRHLPVLILADGRVSSSALRFARHLLAHGYRTSAVHLHIEAIGRFFDVLFADLRIPDIQLSSKDLPQLLTRYVECRRFGTVNLKGDDKLGLFWSSTPGAQPFNELIRLLRFSAYCASHLNSMDAAEQVDRLGLLFVGSPGLANLRGSGSDQYRMLSHLTPRNGKRRPPTFDAPRPQFDRPAPRSFPATNLPTLLESTSETRDKLLWILGAFGATRLSECLNLFSVDVSWNDSDGARILLAHPQLAKLTWVTRFGVSKTSTREQYLEEHYKAAPRNCLPLTHPLYAGWKGMVYGSALDPRQHPLGPYHADIFWLVPEAGIMFWQLHEEYMQRRLRIAGDHPYYFINLTGTAAGEPMTAKNIQQIFLRISNKVGAPTGFYHSLRHFYGYTAINVLKKVGKGGLLENLSLAEVRVMMRHRAESSTSVYAQPSASRIREELLRAWQNRDSYLGGLLNATAKGQ